MEKQRWYKYITVEPPMFFYMLAYMITNAVEQAFYVFKACTVNHGYSKEICYNINNYPDINVEVQVTVSTFLQWIGISTHVVPCCLAFFLGSYSDKRGRKIIMLAGLLGKLYFSVILTLNTMYEWPLEYVIYTAAFPSALTGADLAIFAACFAYIADVSSVETRSLRVGILDIAYLSTMPTGLAIGNVLYNKVFNKSFTAMFTINSCLMIIATMYCIVFMKWQTRPEQKSMKEAGLTNPITDFFDFNNIKQTLRTLSKRRPHNRRLFLWFLLLSMAFYTFQRDERSIMFLYTSVLFHWDLAEYSYFRTYQTLGYVLVMLLAIPLLTKVLKWRDTVIVMLANVSHMSGHLLYAHATTGGGMYAGASVAALGPCVAPIVRSMTSKVLPSIMFLYTSVLFHWDLAEYSYFRTYQTLGYVLVMLLAIPLLTKVLKWRDTVIVMLANVSHMSGHLLYAHATTGGGMYAGASVAALGPCVAPIVRSMTSKVLPSAERGVAYAFLSVMENAVAMFASIIYSQLYKATLGTNYTSSIFYFTIMTQATVFVFTLIMDLMQKGRRLEACCDPDVKEIST